MIDKEMEEITFTEDYSEKLKNIFLEYVKVKSADTTDQTFYIQKGINEFILKKNRVIPLYTEECISKDNLRRTLDNINKEIKKLSNMKEFANKNLDEIVLKAVDMIEEIKNIKKDYFKSTKEKKAEILSKYVQNMVLGNKKVEIIFKKPFSILLNSNEMGKVRKSSGMCLESDKVRTLIGDILLQFQLFFNERKCKKYNVRFGLFIHHL